MVPRKIIKVKHYRSVPAASIPKRDGPALWLLGIIPLVIGGIIMWMTLDQELSFRIAKPEHMDLSRRVVFAYSTLLGLYSTGLLGFALGMYVDFKPLPTQSETVARAIIRLHRRKILILIGSVLLVTAGFLEYLTVFDKIP